MSVFCLNYRCIFRGSLLLIMLSTLINIAFTWISKPCTKQLYFSIYRIVVLLEHLEIFLFIFLSWGTSGISGDDKSCKRVLHNTKT